MTSGPGFFRFASTRVPMYSRSSAIAAIASASSSMLPMRSESSITWSRMSSGTPSSAPITRTGNRHPT